MASAEWQTVPSRRRRRLVNSVRSAATCALLRDDMCLSELLSAHQRLLQTLEAEPCLRHLSQALSDLPPAPDCPLDVICLGLGSPSDFACSRVQLALLHRLVSANCRLSPRNLSIFDPVLSETDCALIARLFGESALGAVNLEGRVELSRPSLLFLPHCPLPLLNNLLFANWTPQGLARLCLLGNRLGEALDAAAASGSDVTTLAFVRAASAMAAEVTVEWTGALAGSMACTSLQCFPRPPGPENAVWLLKDASPPDYSSADLGELIPAVR